MNALLEKLRAMEARQLYAVFAVVILLLVAADYFLVFRFQAAFLENVGGRVEQLKRDIKDLTTNKQRLAQLKEQLERARQSRNDFEAMVHRKDDIPTVLKVISSTANDYGVKVDQLMPQPMEAAPVVKNKDGAYYGMSITVRVRGGYHQFGKFIARLEKERLFWQLGELSIVSDPADPQRHDIRMNMRILIQGK